MPASISLNIMKRWEWLVKTPPGPKHIFCVRLIYKDYYAIFPCHFLKPSRLKETDYIEISGY